ncbi:MAG: sulfotransferase [Dokdonella sp.]
MFRPETTQMPIAHPAELYSQLTQAFNQRAWSHAKELARRLLSLAPRHPVVHYMAGIACMELQQLAPALEHLRFANEIEPTRADFGVQLARALVLAQRSREAKRVADHVLALSPKEPALLDTLGVIYHEVGEYASAASVFHQATDLAPAQPSYRFNKATLLIAAGDLDAAELELQTCIRLDSHFWRAHLTLAHLRRQTPNSHHVTHLESLLSQSGDSADVSAQICLNMALAKELEDLGDYTKSFDHLVRGKEAASMGRDYAIKTDEVLFSAVATALPESREAASGHPSKEPIFIIGMPRSGTTLVERILTSHPDVHSAGELLNFAISLKHVSGSKTAPLADVDTFERARSPDWRRLGEIYLSSTRPRTGHSLRFIDKLPHNFLYAGFIAQALPNAKIICLRRDPMDTCLSNFRQLFATNSPFFGYSFDLLDTGRYYVLFDRLMAHWRRVLPGRILEINYETLVDSQEASSRKLIEFCGLRWSDACLHFEHNPIPVTTASAVQVRAPMYRSAIKRWKNYGSRLDPLRELLVASGIRLDP